jgi:hypothetical protein
MASKELVRLARSAAKAAERSRDAHSRWVGRFAEEYGHDDIADALVEVIDFCGGGDGLITAEYIHNNSKPGGS